MKRNCCYCSEHFVHGLFCNDRLQLKPLIESSRKQWLVAKQTDKVCSFLTFPLSRDGPIPFFFLPDADVDV